MIYNIGDKFLYEGKECKVVYVNAKRAWLATLENPHEAIVMIEENGKDKLGNKALTINNQECLAV